MRMHLKDLLCHSLSHWERSKPGLGLSLNQSQSLNCLMYLNYLRISDIWTILDIQFLRYNISDISIISYIWTIRYFNYRRYLNYLRYFSDILTLSDISTIPNHSTFSDNSDVLILSRYLYNLNISTVSHISDISNISEFSTISNISSI